MRINGQARRIERKTWLLGSAALLAGLSLSSGAMAQCVATGPGAAFAGVLPFARGSSVNALVSTLNTATSVFQAQTGSAFVTSPANASPNENGGGVWGRAIGGSAETKSNSVANLNVGGIGPATVNCSTVTKQDYYGFQVGRDIARLNWDGWNVHMGATAGQMSSFSRDKTADPAAPPTFQSTTTVPFIGSYIAATKGGFFADAQLRADFFNMNVTDPSNAIYGQRFNARGWSIAGGAGYNFALQNNWFIEPSAGFTYSRVAVDPINSSGFDPAGNLVAFPGTAQISDIKSSLGRASVRVGTNITTEYAAIQPFMTGSVFHEFAGDITTNLTTAVGFGNPTIGVLTTDRIGTYGQVSGGFAGQRLGTGWVGYVRGDYRFGEKIEGWTLNTGLRYMFTPEPVAAPVGKTAIYKAAPIIIAPVTWTGFYAGLHAGTISAKTDVTVTDPTTIPPRTGADTAKFGGALAGGQVGYNYQIARWVLGLEGDVSWSNAKGGIGTPVPGALLIFTYPTLFTTESAINLFGTVTGRVGYTWDRTLFFVKGGLAVADLTLSQRANTTLLSQFDGAASRTATGWTVGAGAEYALTANWSAKAEYMFYGLGSGSANIGTLPFITDSKTSGAMGKIGVNYRFSPGLPVMAKY